MQSQQNLNLVVEETQLDRIERMLATIMDFHGIESNRGEDDTIRKINRREEYMACMKKHMKPERSYHYTAIADLLNDSGEMNIPVTTAALTSQLHRMLEDGEILKVKDGQYKLISDEVIKDAVAV